MNKKHVLLLAFCVLFFMYQYGLRSAIPNVLNGDLQNYFGANTSQIGFLVSLSCFAYTIMQIPVGLITDRISVRKIAVSSFLLFSLGLIAFVNSPNLVCASVAQVFLGVSSSFALIMIMKVANDYCSRGKVAFISGLAVSAGGFGPIICNPLIAHLSSDFPWQRVVMLFGFVGVFCSVIGFFVIKEKDLINLHAESESRSSTCSVWQDIKTVISDHRYIGISVFSMATWGACSSFCDAWGVSFMTCVHGISREEAAFAISFAYVGMTIGGPLCAYLSEIFNSFKKVMLGGAACLVVLLGLISFVKLPIVLLFAVLFVMGISAMCQFLAFPAAMSLGERRLGATVTGIVNTITMLGCTILIWAFGYILDWSKGLRLSYGAADYRYGMMASIMFVLIAALILFFTKLPEVRGNSE